MAGIKQLRSWFFGVTSDATRLRNSDKPPQQTFENLLSSVAFLTESTDRARVSTGATLSAEQGLVVLASDAQAKSNASQLTDRSLVVQPHQLPTSENLDVTPIEDEPAATMTIDTGAASTRNQYRFRLSTAWRTWLNSRLIPQGGSAGEVLVKQSSTDYDLEYEQLADNSTFISALLANASFINNLTTQIITNNPSAITEGLEPGFMRFHPVSTLPSSKWLRMDGSSLLRASYPELFTAIGTTYGAADGTHFTLPDFRDKFPMPYSGSKAIASTGGSETHTISSGNLPTHTHDAGTYSITGGGTHGHTWTNDTPPQRLSRAVNTTGADAFVQVYDVAATTDIDSSSGSHSHGISGSTGNGGFANTAINHLNPYLACNFIIKALP
jgi:microcystin-dependent protein